MNVVDSIRNTLVPINREGYPFIAAFAGATLVLGLIWTPLFWIGLILTAWCVYFFRDPERVTPVDDALVIAPADGIVSSVGPAAPPRELGLGSAEMTRISVFMNVFSCHINRAPARGRITRIEHRPGKFLNAELDKASEENERNGLVIESPHGTMAVVQIAGLVARRIVCWVAGERGYRDRRAHRHHPLRLAGRRLPAGGRGAACRRRPDVGGRRNGDRRFRPRCAEPAGTGVLSLGVLDEKGAQEQHHG